MEQALTPNQAAAAEAIGPNETTVAVHESAQAIARPAAPIVALSEDPALVDAMAAAALDVATVIVSPSSDRFVDQLVATGCELALIDAASAPPGLAEFVELLHRQFPQLQLLVAAPGNVQHQIGPQIADGTVFRFVHKPASAQRLRLFVDAALRLRQTRITEEILKTPLTPLERANQTPPSTVPIRGLLLAVVAVASLLGGVALWRHSVQSASHAPAAQPPSRSTLAAQAAVEQEAIDRAAAERSGESERERLAAENDARQAALAEQARQAAIDARYEQLRADVEPLEPFDATRLQIDPSIVQRDAARAADLVQMFLPETLDAPAPPAVRAEPSPPEAAAPTLGADIVEESTLHRVNFIAPLYPMDALIHKVPGMIELDFTVTPQGGVTNIVVTTADPIGVFDRASTTALSRSRYEPVMRDGVAVEQRAHIRLRFTP